MPSGHRIFRAHPGIEYNIRAVVLGGAYPFTFSLSGHPGGMTVNSRTGEISWPSPSGTTVRPTLTVVDSEGATRSSDWTITVSADGFAFYDAARGNDATGDGSLARPFRSLAHCRLHSAGRVVYFRAGTYDMTALPSVRYGSGHERTSWGPVRGSSVQLLAFPGERVIWDHGYRQGGSPGFMVELEPERSSASAQPVFLDGIEFTNVSNCLLRLQVEGHYHTFRRCTFRDIWAPVEGDNPAAVMHVTTSQFHEYCTYQNNVGHRLHHGASSGMYKFYAVRKMLIEDDHAFQTGGPFDLKFGCPRFEIRGCWYHDNVYIDQGVVGNQNGLAGGQCSGEVRYNRITGRGYPSGASEANVINLNNFGLTEQVDVYRNTLVGAIRVQPAAADQGGPFRFRNNVILNNNGGHSARVTFDNPANRGLVIAGTGASANVVGRLGSGIVNEGGDLALVGPSRKAYLGTHGHEIP